VSKDTGKTELKCNECGKVFKKKMGKWTYEVSCPGCKSTDVEVLGSWVDVKKCLILLG